MMQLLAGSDAIALDRTYPFEHSYLTYLVHLTGQISSHKSSPSKPWHMEDLVYGDTRQIGPLPFETEIIDVKAVASGSLGAVWSTFSDDVATVTGFKGRLYAEKFWGDVTPVIEAGLDPIVIDLVRDPRDLIASMRAFNHRHQGRLFGESENSDGVQHLRRILAEMRLRLAEMELPLPVERILVRYEDLVTDQQETCDRVGALLGVSLRADDFQSQRDLLSTHMTSRSAPDSIGRWRADLTDAELVQIDRRLGPAMTALGYPTERRAG